MGINNHKFLRILFNWDLLISLRPSLVKLFPPANFANILNFRNRIMIQFGCSIHGKFEITADSLSALIMATIGAAQSAS